MNRSRALRSDGPQAAIHTRDKLLHAAEELMLRDGYSATRVDDVIRKAGVSKGSFYHFFDSKESLGLAAIDQYYADRVQRLTSGGHSGETDPQRRADRFMEYACNIAPELWKNGCLLANFAADAARSSPVIADALGKRVDELRALLADVLAPYATAELTAADLAEQFVVCIEGAIVLARIYDDSAYLRAGLAQFRRRLEQGAGNANDRQAPPRRRPG